MSLEGTIEKSVEKFSSQILFKVLREHLSSVTVCRFHPIFCLGFHITSIRMVVDALYFVHYKCVFRSVHHLGTVLFPLETAYSYTDVSVYSRDC